MTKIEPTAQIVGHQRINPLTGDTWTEFEWAGDPSGIAAIDWYYTHNIDLLPWPLEVLSEDYGHCRSLVCRKDVAISYIANRVIAAADRMRLRAIGVRARVVLTLQVWGFAYAPPCDIPDWRHIGKRRP